MTQGEQAGLGPPGLALGAPPGNRGQWVSSSGLARGPRLLLQLLSLP